MSDKFKNSKFYRTLKTPGVSRAIYISLVLMLIAVAVVIGITAATNRASKGTPRDPAQTTALPNNTQNPSGTTVRPDTATSAPTTDSTPTTSGTNQTKPVASAVPTLSLPVSGKLSKYHDAKVQVFSETMNDYRVHLGVDIVTAASAPVYAAADGTVSKIWKDTLMGYCIALSHDGNAVTVYKNLDVSLPSGITEGAKISVGQQIATVGESAMIEIADEPHLHFEMTVNGLQVDPLGYYSAENLAALSVDSSYGE